MALLCAVLPHDSVQSQQQQQQQQHRPGAAQQNQPVHPRPASCHHRPRSGQTVSPVSTQTPWSCYYGCVRSAGAEKEGPKVSFSCIFRVCAQYAKQHSFTGMQTLVWVRCLAAIILMFIFSLGFLRWHPSLCIPSSFPPQNSKALQPYGASPSGSQLFRLVPGFSRSDQLTKVL